MKPTFDFLNTAEKRLRLALQELRPELLEGHGVIVHTTKSDSTVVTELDVKVEKRLRDICRDIDPAIGFGGEETGVDLNQKTFWLVDPIDGTEPFIRGLPFSTNMIALIHDDELIMSIIYNFVTDEYYLAIKGRGATKNGHPIHVSSRPFNRSYITINAGFYLPANFAYTLRPKVAGLPRYNASGTDASYIAKGSVDGIIVVSTKGEWDHAPGALLMQEAGARVENLYKNTYNYRDMHYVAANPVIFDELKKLTEDALKSGS
jgi:myo-inositol-1(or 4)-monophosphatase